MLMDRCNLHTILRLPTGIFYAPGVKTNVIFFRKGETASASTKAVWVYDLRANMPAFGKRTALTREHFAAFEASYGDDPWTSPASLKKRRDEGEQERWRRFTRAEIAARGENLDIAWLKDETNSSSNELSSPEALVGGAILELEGALDDLRALLSELGEPSEEFDA